MPRSGDRLRDRNPVSERHPELVFGQHLDFLHQLVTMLSFHSVTSAGAISMTAVARWSRFAITSFSA